MKRYSLTLLALFLMFNISTAQWTGGKAISGNGNVQKEIRDLGTFDRVIISSGLDLYITQGKNTLIEIEADENIIPIILTEIKGNTLKIYSEKSWKNTKKSRVNVTMVTIKSISASGGSDAFSVGTLRSDNMELKSSGGSDLDLNIEVDQLECTVSGGSDADLKGKANHCHMSASGGSDIKASDLQATDCHVSASGGSDAYLNVSGQLDLSASGGSDVYYKGGAKVGKRSVSGSSDVHRR